MTVGMAVETTEMSRETRNVETKSARVISSRSDTGIHVSATASFRAARHGGELPRLRSSAFEGDVTVERRWLRGRSGGGTVEGLEVRRRDGGRVAVTAA